MSDWESFTVKQLQAELKERGLAHAGKKAELIARLVASEEGNATLANLDQTEVDETVVADADDTVEAEDAEENMNPLEDSFIQNVSDNEADDGEHDVSADEQFEYEEEPLETTVNAVDVDEADEADEFNESIAYEGDEHDLNDSIHNDDVAVVAADIDAIASPKKARKSLVDEDNAEVKALRADINLGLFPDNTSVRIEQLAKGVNIKFLHRVLGGFGKVSHFYIHPLHISAYVTYATRHAAEACVVGVTGIHFPQKNPRCAVGKLCRDSDVQEKLAEAPVKNINTTANRQERDTYTPTGPKMITTSKAHLASSGTSMRDTEGIARDIGKAKQLAEERFKKTTQNPPIFWCTNEDRMKGEREMSQEYKDYSRSFGSNIAQKEEPKYYNQPQEDQHRDRDYSNRGNGYERDSHRDYDRDSSRVYDRRSSSYGRGERK